ncbi:hypothetical protein QI362_00820 [Staphylococcus saprophyticus]|nr:hypothetical protein [Staphylococcus saprophyticus]
MQLKLTFEKLMNGDSDIAKYYKNANDLWEKIWNHPKSQNVDDLAQLIGSYQYYFEENCGGEYLGKEIMGWSGYVYLLKSDSDDLFVNNRIDALKEAINKSFLSSEIYYDSDQAIKLFGLNEE